MDIIVIQYYYHMTLVDEIIHDLMKRTNLLSSFPLNLRAPYPTSTFTSNF